MARPLKEGIDYFSLDCYMDDKIRMIQAEFGLKGFAIIVRSDIGWIFSTSGRRALRGMF